MQLARQSQRGRGRPRKFGRPAQLVAVTLPTDVVQSLRARDPDLARAIVGLVERQSGRKKRRQADSPQDVELAAIPARQSLIVVNRTVFGRLPGINIIPLAGDRAFLALQTGLGMADLELAVADRAEDPAVAPGERKALALFRAQLRAWRTDRSLRFQTRAIIVAERSPKKRG
jgi:hypothetical protein